LPFSALSARDTSSPFFCIGLGASGSPLTNWNLPANTETALSEFVRKRDFIDGFQQAGAKGLVNLAGCINNLS
jgi:hypothetical protein